MNLSWRFFIRILAVVFVLYSFYHAGLSLYYIIILGIVFVLIIFLRGKLYKKLDEVLTKNFKFLSNVKPWVKKMIIILIFILVYLILREGVFFVLKLAGINVQQALAESMNQSLNATK